MKNIDEILKENEHDFDSLVSIMAILRGENGCPWDKSQTHHSIRKCLIEETYEVVEAIDNRDSELLMEELGDLIFQAVFHSQIEEENGCFNINDVINGVCQKMIRRHPHIFRNNQVDNASDVVQNWDAIKRAEKGDVNDAGFQVSAPAHLPALIRAQKVHSKAEKCGVGRFISRDEALAHARMCMDDSVADAIFALSAAAEFEGVDIEKEVNDSITNFISQLGNN